MILFYFYSLDDIKECVKVQIEDYCNATKTSSADGFQCKIFRECEKFAGAGAELANAAKQCVLDLCAANTDKFVCQVLQCKLQNAGNGLLQRMAKLQCIQTVCTSPSHTSRAMCQTLEGCKADETGSFNQDKFKKCISKLFRNE